MSDPTAARAYRNVHKRLARVRGKATAHRCAECAGQAHEWAYDHACADERMGATTRGWPAPYSLDPARYRPLCRSCHSRADGARRPAAPAPARPAPAPLPAVPRPLVGLVKRCPTCEQVKDHGEYAPDRSKASGRASRCRPCDAAYCRGRYAAGKRRRTPQGREYLTRKSRTLRARNRARAVEVYGGVCTWCASTKALEFDHVNNDGGVHRAVEHENEYLARVASTGAPLPDWDLQLLCVSCHRSPGWKARRATATPALTCTNTEE